MAQKNPETVVVSGAFRTDIFFGSQCWLRRTDLNHMTFRVAVPKTAFTPIRCAVLTAAPLPPRFLSHCERSAPKQVIRPRAHNPRSEYKFIHNEKLKGHHCGVPSISGCGRKIRTSDLRVMRADFDPFLRRNTICSM